MAGRGSGIHFKMAGSVPRGVRTGSHAGGIRTGWRGLRRECLFAVGSRCAVGSIRCSRIEHSKERNRHMKKQAWIALLMAGAALFSPAGTAPVRQSQQFGINPSGLGGSYDSAYPFIDAIKTASAWTFADRSNKPALDERGYPLLEKGEQAESRVLSKYYPAGTYRFTHEGSGKIEIDPGAMKIVSCEPGRIVLRGKPEGPLVLKLSGIDPQNPPRSFHLWLPGYDETSQDVWHPAFLEKLRMFGTIRFMDWGRINRSPIENWAGRPELADYTYVTTGVPLELLIDLSNRMNASPWLCMPHAADDDYVRRAAELVKKNLNPALRVFVEYSNEVHNPSFTAYRYALEKGKELNLLPDAEAADYPEWRRDAVIRDRFHGLRTKQIAQRWKEVFADQADRAQIVITGGRTSDLGCSLDYQDVAAHVNVIATCSYWGYGIAGRLPKPLTGSLTVDSMFAAVEKDLAEKIGKRCREISELARQYGKPLVLYEGGQHLSKYGGGYDRLTKEDQETLMEVSLQCQRDPRMGELMQQDYDMWFGAGATLYCIYSHIYPASGAFAWGLWEYQDQPTEEAVKARAVMQYIQRD